MRAVKYMWALFACNDLLFRRFGVGESGSCSHCAGRVENAWHVLGTCDDPQAAPLRRRWVDRMWAEVRKEVCRSRQALDIQVANAVCRLWTLEERGNYLRSWAVGSAEAVAGHGLDGRMAELLEGIAKAGSWATWMGVFQPGWIALLREGGMGHSRARRLTTRLSRVISECRADIARMRNERVRAEREVGREERARQLLAAVEALHARDDGSAYTLDQLRAAPRGEQERYRRRRERVERQEMERQRSEAEERLRVRARRKRRREARIRGGKRRREAKAVTGHGIGKRKSASEGRRKRREMGARKRAKGLGADHGEGMTQLGVAASLAGAARRAVHVPSDTDPDSDGSDSEGRVQPVVRGGGGLDAQHGAAIEAMEREQRRRQAAEQERRAVGRARREAVRRDQERRARGRAGARRWRRGGGGGRRRERRRRPGEGGGGATAAAVAKRAGRRLRRQQVAHPNPDSDEEEEEEEAEEAAEEEVRGSSSLSAVLRRRRRRRRVEEEGEEGEEEEVEEEVRGSSSQSAVLRRRRKRRWAEEEEGGEGEEEEGKGQRGSGGGRAECLGGGGKRGWKS